MNIWARVYGTSFIDDACSLDLMERSGRTRMTTPAGESVNIIAEPTIVLYPTEASARTAKQKHGGIVLEITSESLRGQIVVGLMGEKASIPLTDDDNGDEESAPCTAQVYIAHERLGDDVQRLEQDPWLQQLEKELEIEWGS
jgi:hypothetical protein